jgi:hypothetical protein
VEELEPAPAAIDFSGFLPATWSLPEDYASTLYPSLPSDMLPAANQLPALLDAYFASQALARLHRPTFENRLCRGEDLNRNRYREALCARRTGPTLSPRLEPEWYSNDAVDVHMDACLLVAVLWAGGGVMRKAEAGTVFVGIDPDRLNRMERWLVEQHAELMAWFGLDDMEGMRVLQAELFGVDSSRLDAQEGGGGRLGPSDKHIHMLRLHTFHRDVFDMMQSKTVFAQAKLYNGRVQDVFHDGRNIARLWRSVRFQELSLRYHADLRDHPRIWIRDEEKLRLLHHMLVSDLLLCEIKIFAPAVHPGENRSSDDTDKSGTAFGVPFLVDEAALAQLELPCNDILFDSLPSAVTVSDGENEESPYGYFGRSKPRQVVTLVQMAPWLRAQPETSLQSVRGIRSAFEGILESGMWSAVQGICMMVRRFHRLSQWFEEHGLEMHSLQPLRVHAGNSPEDSLATRREAHRLRQDYLETLATIIDSLPVPLKEAFVNVDGDAMVQLAMQHFGPQFWTAL